MSNTQYHKKRTHIKKTLETIDEELKGYFSDNSSLLIELQVERLKLLDRLRYFRPYNQKDVAYRKKVLETFPPWGAENVPDNLRLVFHGTTLANTERILNSGRICSGYDRWTVHTSGDDSGEFSVSTKDFLEISMHYHMDMVETYRDYEWFVPSGCLFVLQLNESEYQFAQEQQRAHNVQLRRNPKKLYAIITTPENQKKVKWWMEKNNFPTDKVVDFAGFQKKIEQEKLFFCLMNYSKQK